MRTRIAVPPLLLVGGLAVALSAGALPAANRAPSAPSRAWSKDALVELIDQTLSAHWKEVGIRPTSLVDDATYLRRLSLDLRGTIPTRHEVDDFLRDDGPDKRARLARTLLDDPATAAHLAQIWQDLLLSGAQRSRFSAPLGPWLAEQFQQKAPFSQIAHELISAQGSSIDSGAVGFLASYRSELEAASAVTARTFLGLQIQCAQCHDHPLDDWTQAQFNEFTAFFTGTRIQDAGNMDDGFRLVDTPLRGRELERLRRFVKQRQAEEGDENEPPLRREPGMTRRQMADQMLQRLPPEARERLRLARERQEKFGSPRFLDGSDFLPAANTTMRQGLADWMVDENNPWFARAVVNRVWDQVFGHALTEPVDDLTGAEDHVLPRLLDTLSTQFHRQGTNLHRLLEVLVSTEAYQRKNSTASAEDAAELERHFAAHPIRPFSAEQVLNGLRRATELERFAERPGARGRRGRARDMEDEEEGMGAEMADPRMLERFRYVFSDDEGGMGDSFEAGIPQALFLMNGRMTNDAITLLGSPLLREIVDESLSDKYRLQQMFYATLGRKPTSRESTALFRMMRQSGRGKAGGMTDVYWALLNCSEFLTNH